MPSKNDVLFKMILNKDLVIISVGDSSIEQQIIDELSDRKFSSLIHPDYQPTIVESLDKLSDGLLYQTEVLFGRVAGKYKYLSLEASLNDGNYEVSFLTATNLIEPKVVSINKDLEKLAYKILGVYYRTDMFGNLIYVSDHVEEIIGYKSEQVIGISLRKDFYRNPDQYDSVKDIAIDSGKIADVDIATKHKDGSVLWVRLDAVIVYDENGEYSGSSGYIKDITAEKNKEEELAHSKRLLELKQKEIDSMTVSMKYRVQSQVSKGRKEEESILYHARLAEMGEMVGSIAHQWRQPLSALMFIIEDIRDAYHFGELDIQYLDDAIDECMTYIRFMSDTMDDFRNFFRPEPEKEQFHVVEKLVQVVKMQYGRFEVGAVNVKIQCDLGEIGGEMHDVAFIEYGKGIRIFEQDVNIYAEILAYGYPNLFKQVIINLINNSIDSIMESRSQGALGVTEAGLINICVRASDHRIFLEIEDNGVGINEEDFEKIFEAEYTTKPKNQGTGIGLHMARAIVEKSLGGKIKAGKSENGALFIIELPRVSVTVR